MAVYAVGDLQGCLEPLQCLLEHVHFNPEQDRLWLVGDWSIVARNRWKHFAICTAFANRWCACSAIMTCTCWQWPVKRELLKKGDTLLEILEAPDRDDLLGWIRRQKLMHYDAERNVAMVHAGIAPQWTLKRP